MARRHISIVVSEEQAEMLTQMAAEQGESLSSYVRGRIMAKDNMEAEFRSLQTGLIAAIHETSRGAITSSCDALPAETSTPDSAQISGSLVEILLHLRSLGDPSKNRSIRAEVARLGFTPLA